MGVSEIFNNTVLIPYHDSLVDSNQLPASNIALDIANVQKVSWNKDKDKRLINIQDTYIKVYNKSSVFFQNLQSISDFGMTRMNTQKYSGGNGDYVVNLPGPITYSDITLTHIHTRDSFFLDWLKNGYTLGGSYRADIEIHIVPAGKKKMVFTLYDAFPISWSLIKLTSSDRSIPLMENVTVTYSKIHFEQQDVS